MARWLPVLSSSANPSVSCFTQVRWGSPDAPLKCFASFGHCKWPCKFRLVSAPCTIPKQRQHSSEPSRHSRRLYLCDPCECVPVRVRDLALQRTRLPQLLLHLPRPHRCVLSSQSSSQLQRVCLPGKGKEGKTDERLREQTTCAPRHRGAVRVLPLSCAQYFGTYGGYGYGGYGGYPPPAGAAYPPPVSAAPPPLEAPPPITLAPPPITLAPPPVVYPPPVTIGPPPVAYPPPVTVAPPPVTLAPPPVVYPPPVLLAPPPVRHTRTHTRAVAHMHQPKHTNTHRVVDTGTQTA